MNNSTAANKRTVYAPNNGEPISTCAILSVDLYPDEDVIWDWSFSIDGKKYVSGYTIVKKNNLHGS